MSSRGLTPVTEFSNGNALASAFRPNRPIGHWPERAFGQISPDMSPSIPESLPPSLGRRLGRGGRFAGIKLRGVFW
jgi:hypothetical protein